MDSWMPIGMIAKKRFVGNRVMINKPIAPAVAAFLLIGIGHLLTAPAVRSQDASAKLVAQQPAKTRGFAHYRKIMEKSAASRAAQPVAQNSLQDREIAVREDIYHLNHVTSTSKLILEKQTDDTPPTVQNHYIFLNTHRSKR